MITNAQNVTAGETGSKGTCIKAFGVGGGGINVTELLLKSTLPGVDFAAVDVDAQSLAASGAAQKVLLETRLLRGLGSGGDPERGRALAEEQFPQLKSLCEGMDVVFILAGLGGGAGTGVAPVVARAGKEAGALVLAFATTPFQCEGSRRQRLAQQGLAELKATADGAICLPNQKVFQMIDENTSLRDTFNITNEFLATGVRGIWRLLLHKGLIEIHFADLAAMVRDRHTESAFAVAEATGPARSREVLEKLLAHPMLDGGQRLAESEAVLVSMLGGPDLTMAEVNRVMEQINRQCEQAQVIMGAAIDEAFDQRLAVTLIAARTSTEPLAVAATGHPEGGEESHQRLLPDSGTVRRNRRFPPPGQALPPDQVQQLLTRQSRSAGLPPRKGQSRMRQGQLQLEIVSKGRFDKSEPTIHRGEDLDVPTYIRRGVPLN